MDCHNMYERLNSRIIVGEAYYRRVRNIVEDTKFIIATMFCPCFGHQLTGLRKNTKYFICSKENMQENRTQDELIVPLSFPA